MGSYSAPFQSSPLGTPFSGATYDGNGNLSTYTDVTSGVTYTFTYTTVNGLTLPLTKVGGGRTVTWSYNALGQVTSAAFS